MNSVTSKMASLNVRDLHPNVTESPSAVPAPARKPLTIYMLESADLDEQIRMLHEYMLPLVQEIQPTRAKVITNLVIQGENNFDLLNLIRKPNLLRAQVEQIAAVLQAREAGQDVRFPAPKKNKRRRKKKNVQ
ncbi:polyadenylate-binding protein 1-like [Tachysurus vachellii]|uniref:polyadenylate-binding protein 1-like n=1 Tax=Tachysurus vachellii TaxID=175792 RepID=UPI00296B3398|nr:polyadenylate-binding protein 1-like [Tachysurus vachellii]XP_060725220.1 polyadenylate-binding protein 1-like [Tachysurus vachellii]XP_060725221.1 polyadenylate-binding protein 1-like [Tachysurus vachellii]XP_060725222.1 polyadenylate-binding protein 1-like [Tachysurus vachellii]